MEIIFWLDTVPQVCKGVFNEVSKQWKDRCFYVVTGKIDENRKLINSQSSFGNAEIIYLYDSNDVLQNGLQFIREHKRAIHIFNGYKSKTSFFLNYLIKNKSEETKIIVWAERPLPKWKTYFPFSLLHYRYALKYRNVVDALLPLGEEGIRTYRRLGWPENKMFPFLYLPIMDECLPEHKDEKKDIIDFIYLGRFSKSKGVDVLIKACKSISHLDFRLTMVGGYGPIKDKVINWCNSFKKATFRGTWPIDEAVNRLYDYDVCIVPSRYDGWNVTTNEALMAGIGVIVSDEAVSDEMVKKCGAGSIVKAGNTKGLAKAMENIVANPDIVRSWKSLAYKFRNKMSSTTCANYFIEVVMFICGNIDERPVAPWK